MQPRHILAAALLCSTAFACSIASGNAEILLITVQDENNKGVPSDVYIYKTTKLDESNQLLVGETDKDGIYRETHKCEQPQVIRVRPKSRGVYFDPLIKPCKQESMIPVLHRETSVAVAFSGTISDVVLPDGSPGVIATWAYLDISKSDKKAPAATETVCDVTIRPRLDQRVYKLADNKLVPIAKGNTLASQILTSFKERDQFSAVFPSPCLQAGGGISTLENSAAESIDKALTAGVSDINTFKMLNVH